LPRRCTCLYRGWRRVGLAERFLFATDQVTDLPDFVEVLLTAVVAMSPAAARRLRLMYEVQGAALAAASLLLGRPHPEVLGVANAYVDRSVRTLATTVGECVAIPEYARSLLRGCAGQWLVPPDWAHDIAATYWTLRLDEAQRCSGVEVLHPDTPVLLPPMPWHERYDPGAQELAQLTRSGVVCSLACQHALHQPPSR
jgi:hypothetical protein